MASSRRLRSVLGGVLTVFAVTGYGCSTTSSTLPLPASGTTASAVITGPKQPTEIPSDLGIKLNQVSFSQLPGWNYTQFLLAKSSFLGSCRRWSNQSSDALISRSAPYGGKVSDWLPLCQKLEAANNVASVKSIFETEFVPFSVLSSVPKSRLTGYFEPEIDVRYLPEPGFTKSVPGIPEDLVLAEPSKFDPKFPKGKIWGKVVNGNLDYYPDRADIIDAPDKALGYASEGEVFYLQIQGSGRLNFPDGRTIRAAFAAHNHKPFVSIAQHLIDSGKIEQHQAGMNSILNWMKQVGPKAATEAMNVNPRYVWFVPQEITDPTKGPNGAQGVPLTPMASMAVDPKYHPYGVPMFLDTKIPSKPGDWKGNPFRDLVIAQDTGGAIKGVLRGDLFFGWGDDAGGRAASMNHDVAMWVLLPKSVAENLEFPESGSVKKSDSDLG